MAWGLSGVGMVGGGGVFWGQWGLGVGFGVKATRTKSLAFWS